MRSKVIKCKNMQTTIKTIRKHWGMHFAANVLQSKHGTCPLSVFACCLNERSFLRPINEVKGHKRQKYVSIINSVIKPCIKMLQIFYKVSNDHALF